MGWILGKGIGIPFRTGGKESWSTYWSPQSAVVENSAPTDIVLTYDKAVNPTDAVTANFSVAGKTITSATLDGTGKILTLVVTVAFVYGDSIVVVANSENIAVTNNILATAELTLYITGLATPLSLGQRRLINEFIKSLKTMLSISSLSDFFDTLWILAGETAESSLKNLVKNDNHCTAVNSPTFTALEGFNGNATNMFLKTDYIPSVDNDNYLLNDAAISCYIRQNPTPSGNRFIHGSYDLTSFVGASDSSTYHRMNNLTTDTPASATAVGMNTMSRGASTNYIVYRNSAAPITITRNSVALPTVELYLIAVNNNGSPANYSLVQISMVYLSKAVTQTQHNNITTAFEAYMDANGKGVI